MRQPHALGAWLIDRFVLNEPLAGDLAEEYAQGRSQVWCWKQVVSAVVLDGFLDIRGHKLLSLRAVVLGGVLVAAWIFLFNTVVVRVVGWNYADSAATAFAIPIVGYFLIGLLVGWSHRTPMVFVFLAAVLAAKALPYVGLAPEGSLSGFLSGGCVGVMKAIVGISFSGLVTGLWNLSARPSESKSSA